MKTLALSPEQRKQRIDKYIKYGLIGVTALVVSPIIFLVVKGIVGLAIAGVLGLAVITFAPVVSMKFANWKVTMIKAEAATNPIPTLQTQLVERRNAQRGAKQRLEQSNSALTMFKSKRDRLSLAHPRDAKQFDDQVALLQKAQDSKLDKWKQVNHQLDLFEAEIEKASAVWDVTQSMIEAKRAMGIASDIDPMEKIKTETALDSVQLSLAQATSDLEMSLAEDGVVIEGEVVPLLEHQPSDPINIQQQVRVGVRRNP